MEATEAPPQRAPDDLLATGWAAPARVCDPKATITLQSRALVEIALRNDRLIAERDAALDTAARHAEENRELRARVAVQRATIARLQRAAEPAVMARIGDAVDSKPCVCLADAQPAFIDPVAAPEPVRGRVLPWVRRSAPRWSR